MEQISPATDQLFVALMAAHKEFGVIIPKDSKGHKGTYASLPAVLEFIHTMCSHHGLILTQAPCLVDSMAAVQTRLEHPVSKQSISCLSLLTTNPGAQSADQVWGGSSTYHRRYDAMMLCGLFCEDDPTDNDCNNEVAHAQPITEKQLGLLQAKIAGDKNLESVITSRLKIKSLAEMPWKEFNAVLKYVESVKQ